MSYNTIIFNDNTRKVYRRNDNPYFEINGCFLGNENYPEITGEWGKKIKFHDFEAYPVAYYSKKVPYRLAYGYPFIKEDTLVYYCPEILRMEVHPDDL